LRYGNALEAMITLPDTGLLVARNRQVCAFSNNFQSIEFTRGRLQSSCRNISWMINGNRIHLSSISILIAKGLNTYVNKVFLFLSFINLKLFLKTSFQFVIMGYCDVIMGYCDVIMGYCDCIMGYCV
jgi:hypothetical protein